MTPLKKKIKVALNILVKGATNLDQNRRQSRCFLDDGNDCHVTCQLFLGSGFSHIGLLPKKTSKWLLKILLAVQTSKNAALVVAAS